MNRIRRSNRAWFMVLALLTPAAASAQHADPLTVGGSPALGGAGLFVSSRAAWSVSDFRVGGEFEIGWGGSNATRGGGYLGVQLPLGLVVIGGWTGSSASTLDASRTDRAWTATVQSDLGGLSARRRSGRAAFDGFSSDLRGTDIRGWVGLGSRWDLELGLAVRTTEVIDRAEGVWERRFVVAGYEFVSARRYEYLAAATHRDVEADLSATVSPFRIAAILGHGVSSGPAPDRSWGFLRVATPLAGAVDFIAEAGRNEGIPSIGRMPHTFVQLGVRLDLGRRNRAQSDNARGPTMPDPGASPVAYVDGAPGTTRLIIAAYTAESVEVKGDFTAWQTRRMTRHEDGTWSIPISPGVIRFNVRLDGGSWGVPSGVPAVPDEFSGAPVAVVIVDASDRPRS